MVSPGSRTPGGKVLVQLRRIQFLARLGKRKSSHPHVLCLPLRQPRLPREAKGSSPLPAAPWQPVLTALWQVAAAAAPALGGESGARLQGARSGRSAALGAPALPQSRTFTASSPGAHLMPISLGRKPQNSSWRVASEPKGIKTCEEWCSQSRQRLPLSSRARGFASPNPFPPLKRGLTMTSLGTSGMSE